MITREAALRGARERHLLTAYWDGITSVPWNDAAPEIPVAGVVEANRGRRLSPRIRRTAE